MCRLGSLLKEQSSFANEEKASASHYALEYIVDFEGKKLVGSVAVTVRKNDASATEVVLDSNHLHFTQLPEGATLDAEVTPFGRAVRVPLPADLGVGETTVVSIGFETTPQGSALQFLAPEQTAGKTHPYLFSQCQAIHARSMLPCQDAPGVKATYSAKVTVPAPLVAVMSAIAQGEPTEDASAGTRTFAFSQTVPIATYLIALAVGNIDSRVIGPRSRVFSEPEVVESAAYEFAETEAMIAAAEAMVGPYVWGEYNILVLPPSFPYGGMENPTLTFVTPTLLAGDRSLADVIAHELAHSWSGNLVTNQTANAFMLNEGWTMFLERKILAALHGERAFHFSAMAGVHALEGCVKQFTERGETEFTKLVPQLEGIDPDDAFSSVPYEKGFSLLYAIASAVGEDRFGAFMHDYFQTFKYTSITADDFRAYATAYFAEGRFALPRVGHTGVPPAHGGPQGPHDPSEVPSLARLNPGGSTVPPAGVDSESAAAAAAQGIDLSQSIDWEAWYYAAGGCPCELTFDAAEREAVDAHAEAWVADPPSAAAWGPSLTSAWPSSHWIAFAQALSKATSGLASQGKVLAPAVLRRMDALYGLSGMRNAEVRCQWGAIAVRSGLAESVPGVVAFLKEQGRMKYVRPLFCELARTASGRPLAQALFAEHGPSYHPICAKMVASDLDKECAKAPVDPASLVVVHGEEEAKEQELVKEEAPSAAAAAAVEEAAPAPAPAAEGEGEEKEEEAASEQAVETEAAAAPAPAAAEEPVEAAAAPTASEPAAEAPAAAEAAVPAHSEPVEPVPAKTAAADAPAPVPAAAAPVVSDGGVEAVEDVDEDEDEDDEEGEGAEDEEDEEDADDGEEDEEEEEEEEDAPPRRVRFGQSTRKASAGPRRVTFAAGTAVSPPPSPGPAPFPPAPTSTAVVSAAPAAAAVPDPKVLAARAELSQVAALRAERGLSPLAAARQTKGLPARGASSTDDEDAGAAVSSAAGSGSRNPLVWAASAAAFLLDAPLVSESAAETLSTGLAMAVVGGAFAAAAWFATRRRY